MITDRQVVEFIVNVGKAGGEISIAPHDWLNPGNGYAATVKFPASTTIGFAEVKDSGDTGIEALRQLIRVVNRL